jgi:ribonucleoside-diphosphate reductase alpha chain
LVDYIFRWLGMQFIDGYREQNAPRRSKPADTHAGSAGAGGAAAITHSKEAEWPARASALPHADRTDAPSGSDRAAAGWARADASPSLASRAVTDIPAASIIDGSAGARIEATVTETVVVAEVHAEGSALKQSNAQLMGDAPPCSTCGEITVRNGTCYRCLNCGTSMGCS